MVDITTTTNAVPQITSWSIPESAEESAIPRGEVVFAGVQTIPSKLAADDNVWRLNMLLPRNWVYRLVEAQIFGFSDDDGEPFQEGQPLILGTVRSDAVGSLDWFFTLRAALGIGISNFDGVTNNVWNQWVLELQNIDGALIDAGGGNGQVFTNWLDKSTDSTITWEAHFRFRMLMYDIRQVNFWPMHAPTPIISA